MDYARLVRVRRELWDDFDRRLRGARAEALDHEGLETLAFQYRKVLHDHALASARHPGSAAARRLHRLALEGTHQLLDERRGRTATLRSFFTRSFPAAFRRQLPQLGVAAALFGLALVFGITMAAAQPGLGALLLGPSTLARLESGHLWTESLVTAIPPSISSSTIATNNMSVAITAFAGGAMAGIGSLYVVLLNGFLLGAVGGITFHYGMAGALLEFVAAHGPLEITLILTSAAAGLSLGTALVGADDRPRRQALAQASREATTVLLGCLPWFLLLGLVEGVLSPAPGVGAGVKALVGLSLLGLFLAVGLNPRGREGAA